MLSEGRTFRTKAKVSGNVTGEFKGQGGVYCG